MIKRLVYLLVTFIFVMLGFSVAQEVGLLDPESWFGSVESVVIAASLITPWITKVFTALGKDWFHTDGRATQWLSLAVAIVIGGVGGYLSLGYFADVSGVMGALNAAIVTLVAFLGSNGMAKSERQVAAATARRISDNQQEG